MTDGNKREPYHLAKDLAQKAATTAKNNPIAAGVGVAAVAVAGTGLITGALVGIAAQAIFKNRDKLPKNAQDAQKAAAGAVTKAENLFGGLVKRFGGATEGDKNLMAGLQKRNEEAAAKPARKPRAKKNKGPNAAP